jgi:spore germination cell wall hydrolase CwlJ-like protein
VSFLVQPDALAVITIWQEARGESYEGKLGVAEVIRNRMQRNYSSDGTVAGTVLKPYQFSAFLPGDPNLIPSFKIDDTDPIVIDCIRAWNESKTTNRTNGAVLYCNLKILERAPNWAIARNKVAEIGEHTFYRA